MPVFLTKKGDNTTHMILQLAFFPLHFVLRMFHWGDTEIDLVLFNGCIVFHGAVVILFVGQVPD